MPKTRTRPAIHFVPEPENERIDHITYQELYVRVNEFAALLLDFAKLKTGDRVTLHMPMSAELPITMLACARLGIIHSQVFGGFSGKSCADRIEDSQSRVLITMDSYWRGGTLLDHKANADIAVDLAAKDGQKVDTVPGVAALPWQILRRDPHGGRPRPLRQRHPAQVLRRESGPGFHARPRPRCS